MKNKKINWAKWGVISGAIIGLLTLIMQNRENKSAEVTNSNNIIQGNKNIIGNNNKQSSNSK